MLHGETVHWQCGLRAGGHERPVIALPCERSERLPLRHSKENYDSSEDHEVGIEQEENTGMVKTPFPLQAAGRLCHAPRGHH